MKHRPRYEDAWDLIVQGFIRDRQPFAGYWERSESHVLRFIDSEIVVQRRRLRMLDLGCGSGRLLPRSSASFEKVVAIEPDPERFRHAEQICHEAGLTNVELILTFFEDYEVELPGFDVIFCGHVIQHLDADSVSAIMEKVGRSLVAGGVLILLTSCSNRDADAYSIWESGANGAVTEKAVTEESFSDLLLDGHNPTILPIRKFGNWSIAKLQPNLRLREMRYFHAIGFRNWLDGWIFRDRWINWPGFRGRFGIDIALVWEKPVIAMLPTPLG